MINEVKFHPGSYLKDIIECSNISKDEIRTIEKNLSIKKGVLNMLASERISVTEDLSRKLEVMTGVSSKTWMKLQEIYDFNEGEKRFTNDYMGLTDNDKVFSYHQLLSISKDLNSEQTRELIKVLNRSSDEAIKLAIALNGGFDFFFALEKTGNANTSDPILLGQAVELFLYEMDGRYKLPDLVEVFPGVNGYIIGDNDYEAMIIKSDDGLIPIVYSLLFVNMVNLNVMLRL